MIVMKKIVLSIGSIMLIMNCIFCICLSAYTKLNCILNCATILFTMFFLITLYLVRIKDVFKISLSFIGLFVLVLNLILGCFVPPYFKENIPMLIIILLSLFEMALLIIAKSVSKKN